MAITVYKYRENVWLIYSVDIILSIKKFATRTAVATVVWLKSGNYGIPISYYTVHIEHHTMIHAVPITEKNT